MSKKIIGKSFFRTFLQRTQNPKSFCREAPSVGLGKQERQMAENASSLSEGKMTFADALQIYRQRPQGGLVAQAAHEGAPRRTDPAASGAGDKVARQFGLVFELSKNGIASTTSCGCQNIVTG
ncbi:MAG TPA: hypothetical protein VGO59_12220 [Verrucomicrobiae bacterium]|jgi:hypothetical protein